MGGYPLGSEKAGALWRYNHDIKGTKIKNVTTNQLIRKIYTENVEVEFIYTEGLVNGNDVDGWDRRINRIIIKDKIQEKQKEFHFEYGIYSGELNGGRRLKLVSIQEKGFDNMWKPAYKFTYDPSNSFGLPRPTSYGKDYKGFYNGKNNNTSLLPKTAYTLEREVHSYFGNTTVIDYPKYERLSDRYFHEDFLKIGSLKKIEYPTGGSTEFIYEANAIGENQREPLLETSGFLMTNFFNEETSTYPDYNGMYPYIYSQLVKMDNVVGRIKLSLDPSSVCPDCPCSTCEDTLEQPVLFIYEYFGLMDEPIDYNEVGVLLSQEPIKGINPATPNYMDFDPSPSTDNYIIMLKLGGTASEYNGSDDYPMLINMDWNKKAADASGNVRFQKHYLGGLRIKEIKDIDIDGNEYNRTNYNYINAYIADELDSEMNNIKVSGIEGLGGQLIYTSEKQAEHGTQTASGYCYTEIEIEKIGPGSYGKTIEYYDPKYSFYNLSGGDLKKKIVRNENNDILFHEETIFTGSEFGDIQIQFSIPSLQHEGYDNLSQCLLTPPNNPMPVNKPVADYYDLPANQKYDGRWRLPDSTVTTQFLTVGNELKPVTTVKKYHYKTAPLLVEKEVIDTRYTANVDIINGNIDDYLLDNPNGEVIEIDYQYVWEFKPEIPWTVPDGLPISKEVRNGTTQVLGQYFEYDDKGNIKNTYRYNKGEGSHNGPIYVPAYYELDVAYLTEQGKPTQVYGQDGVVTSYIWGYNDQYPVAKILGIPYANIPTGTINSIKAFSIANPYNETSLITALDALRTSYPNAQITTYTYNPMVGISTVTDPKGIRVDYIYDGLGRLKYIKDQEGNIVGKNEYNYKTN